MGSRFFSSRPQGFIEKLQGLPDKEINKKIDLLYDVDCCNLPTLSDEPPDDLIELVTNMLKRIYVAKELPTIIDKGVTRYFAETFFKAVVEGFGESFLTLDFDTPDYFMLRHLEENVYQFAAAKNYQMMESATRQLIGEDGKLRSFTEFKKACFEKLNLDITTYMRAEYNLAVAGGQMAATWLRIQENKESMPLLKYVTVGDDRVRPEHAELEGVTRPVDDTFWDIYYPPNGWNCRCDVMQLADGVETPLEDIITPEKMPDLFKGNIGKNGLVFPADHPYYDGIPPKILEQAQKLLTDRG